MSFQLPPCPHPTPCHHRLPETAELPTLQWSFCHLALRQPKCVVSGDKGMEMALGRGVMCDGVGIGVEMGVHGSVSSTK